MEGEGEGGREEEGGGERGRGREVSVCLDRAMIFLPQGLSCVN